MAPQFIPRFCVAAPGYCKLAPRRHLMCYLPRRNAKVPWYILETRTVAPSSMMSFAPQRLQELGHSAKSCCSTKQSRRSAKVGLRPAPQRHASRRRATSMFLFLNRGASVLLQQFFFPFIKTVHSLFSQELLGKLNRRALQFPTI